LTAARLLAIRKPSWENSDRFTFRFHSAAVRRHSATIGLPRFFKSRGT